MPTDPPPSLEGMAAALAEFDKACRMLFYAMDDAPLFPSLHLSTSVLLALDHARECAARMGFYLTALPVNEVLCEEEAGPTEDQPEEDEESPEQSGELDPDVGPFVVMTHDRLPWE